MTEKSKLYSAGAFSVLRPSVPHVNAGGVVNAAGSNHRLMFLFAGSDPRRRPDWRGCRCRYWRETRHGHGIRKPALQHSDSANLPTTDDVARRRRRSRMPSWPERQQIGRGKIHAMAYIAVGTGPVGAAVARVLRNRPVRAAVAADIVEAVRPRPVTRGNRIRC